MADPKKYKADFAQIRQTISMEAILDRYDLTRHMQRKPHELRGKCPLCGGSDTSKFSVDLNKNGFHCFGCKAKGNVIEFVRLKEGLSTIKQAAEQIWDWFNLGSSEASIPKPPKPAEQGSDEPEEITENTPLPPEFKLSLDPKHEYLSERQLSGAVINEFACGYCSTGKTMKGRIAIPVHNAEGQLVAFVGRWPGNEGWPDGEGKYKFPPRFKKSLEVFNLHRAIKEDPKQPLVIVEGYFDAMHLWQLGYRRVVALMGSDISDAQRDLIAKHDSWSEQVIPRLIVMLDNDDAGRLGTAKVFEKLGDLYWITHFKGAFEDWQPTDLDEEGLARLMNLVNTKEIDEPT